MVAQTHLVVSPTLWPPPDTNGPDTARQLFECLAVDRSHCSTPMAPASPATSKRSRWQTNGSSKDAAVPCGGNWREMERTGIATRHLNRVYPVRNIQP